MATTKPQKKTLTSVFAWLEEQGLSVYGPYIDLDSGQSYGGCSDYTVEDTIKLAKLNKDDAIWEEE